MSYIIYLQDSAQAHWNDEGVIVVKFYNKLRVKMNVHKDLQIMRRAKVVQVCHLKIGV